MKILISGHRKFKLEDYDLVWIKEAINESIKKWINLGMSIGLSGMANGVDLIFCELCYNNKIPYIACPPFEGQELTIGFTEKEVSERTKWLTKAKEIWKIRNSFMVEKCNGGIIVFNGEKGGTHNVFQQMLEKQKQFIWINPISQKCYDIF